MRETRLRVDALLAADRIDEAEEYMEARQEFFWDHGYHPHPAHQSSLFLPFTGHMRTALEGKQAKIRLVKLCERSGTRLRIRLNFYARWPGLRL